MPITVYNLAMLKSPLWPAEKARNDQWIYDTSNRYRKITAFALTWEAKGYVDNHLYKLGFLVISFC